MLARAVYIVVLCTRAFRGLFNCLRNSPLVGSLITIAAVVLTLLAIIFNIALVRIFTSLGAFLINLGLLWLLLRLVVRALVFPGSMLLFRRNTEASWRVEMAKQFHHHLENLHDFLTALNEEAQQDGSFPSGTMDGVMLGCVVVETLSRNFRFQQRDKVAFTAEQARVRLLVQGIETWLRSARVMDRRGRDEVQLPLLDWVQRHSEAFVPVSMRSALAGTSLSLPTDESATDCSDRVEQLVAIFDGLQRPQEGLCASTKRFLSVPTIGSLHHWRAELQARYPAQHLWIRAPGGRKIDAMFISCHGLDGNLQEDDDAGVDAANPTAREDIPLRGMEEGRGFVGPVIIWCNPNAQYYETMCLESQWLDFYLAQGCSLLIFNYGGYGRSQGGATTAGITADGRAVLEHLRRRGFTQIGVHGRSIGGIAACSIAQANPDLVKFLIADRTLSTLARIAKIMFGNWAKIGLSLSATWADNVDGYCNAKCYKVLICDPKDSVIPDLASLRTAVALHALEQAPKTDKLKFEADQIERMAEAWGFFETLIGICDRDEVAFTGNSSTSRSPIMIADTKRSARQPVVGKPTDADARPDAGEEDSQRLMAGRAGTDGRRCTLNSQWLEEHGASVRTAITPHIDCIRIALDAIGSHLNAGGMTLDDVMGQASDEPKLGLESFLANLQVWGSLGSGGLQEALSHVGEKDVERLIQQGPTRGSSSLMPERLATYNRQLSRVLVAQVRREFRQHVASLRRSLEPLMKDENQFASQLCTAILAQLQEIESFMTAIYRFFKCVDIVGAGVGNEGPASDDSEEGREHSSRPMRPTFDRSQTGYVMCIDSGHNGNLSDAELHHLVLHLQAARFGKYSASGDGH